MITDRDCLRCEKYTFSLSDALGARLNRAESNSPRDRGRFYFDVECEACGQRQGLVIRGSTRMPQLFTIWPCSWNDETCMTEGCVYCDGEYV